MQSQSFVKLAVALSVALLAGATGLRATVLYHTSFDTPTGDLTGTLATYGLTNAGLTSGYVGGGALHLTPALGHNASVDLGAFGGNLLITLGVTTTGELPVHINVGLRIGDNNLIFHPGYTPGEGAFRIDNYHGNYAMGFTPAQNIFHRMVVSIDGTTGFTQVSVTDGANPGNVYAESYFDINYLAGSTLIGLTAGSSFGTGRSQFDFITVESTSAAVPEAGSALLPALAGAALWLARRRLGFRFGRPQFAA